MSKCEDGFWRPDDPDLRITVAPSPHGRDVEALADELDKLFAHAQLCGFREGAEEHEHGSDKRATKAWEAYLECRATFLEKLRVALRSRQEPECVPVTHTCDNAEGVFCSICGAYPGERERDFPPTPVEPEPVADERLGALLRSAFSPGAWRLLIRHLSVANEDVKGPLLDKLEEIATLLASPVAPREPER